MIKVSFLALITVAAGCTSNPAILGEWISESDSQHFNFTKDSVYIPYPHPYILGEMSMNYILSNDTIVINNSERKVTRLLIVEQSQSTLILQNVEIGQVTKHKRMK